MFNVHYISDTALYAKANKLAEDVTMLGKILSYQEGPVVTPLDEIDMGMAVLSYPSVVNIWDDAKTLVTMKVDTVGKQLVANVTAIS